MKKSDLETGMLVQLRNGNILLVVNDVLIDKDNFIPLDSYNNDLLCVAIVWDVKIIQNFDIIKVSHVITVPYVSQWNEQNINKYLKWERKEDNTIKDVNELDNLKNSLNKLCTLLEELIPLLK